MQCESSVACGSGPWPRPWGSGSGEKKGSWEDRENFALTPRQWQSAGLQPISRTLTPCYLRPPCLCGKSQQQSRHLVLDLQLVVLLLLLRNHLLSMLLCPLLHGELLYHNTIHPDPRQRSPVSHQKRITPSLRSHQRIYSVQWHWVYCSSLTSHHAVVNISQRSLPREYREREYHVGQTRLSTSEGDSCVLSSQGERLLVERRVVWLYTTFSVLPVQVNNILDNFE